MIKLICANEECDSDDICYFDSDFDGNTVFKCVKCGTTFSQINAEWEEVLDDC